VSAISAGIHQGGQDGRQAEDDSQHNKNGKKQHDLNGHLGPG
jgi:hypothetical protein